jgi:hypothetical protein
MVAVENAANGNFTVKTAIDSILIYAFIVKSPTGWRVISNLSTRKNSRTASKTPQAAAKKYFNSKVEFIMTRVGA